MARAVVAAVCFGSFSQCPPVPREDDWADGSRCVSASWLSFDLACRVA